MVMKYKYLLVLLLSLSSTVSATTGADCQADPSKCLPPQWQRHVGKTFAVPGPNCFATALKVAGLYPTFRGVDVNEFQSFISQACEPVSEPQAGDIGVFTAPNGVATHAYFYVSPEWTIEKPGVDYSGPTAVVLQRLESVHYRAGISPECRRYSSDPSLCANQHQYVRCSQMPLSGELAQLQRSFNQFDQELSVWIEGQAALTLSREDWSHLLVQKADLTKKLQMSVGEGNSVQVHYFNSRLESLEKQLKFIELSLLKSK